MLKLVLGHILIWVIKAKTFVAQENFNMKNFCFPTKLQNVFQKAHY